MDLHPIQGRRYNMFTTYTCYTNLNTLRGGLTHSKTNKHILPHHQYIFVLGF